MLSESVFSQSVFSKSVFFLKCIYSTCIPPKCIFPKCICPKYVFAKYTRLACLLSFASLFGYFWCFFWWTSNLVWEIKWRDVSLQINCKVIHLAAMLLMLLAFCPFALNSKMSAKNFISLLYWVFNIADVFAVVQLKFTNIESLLKICI